MPERMENQPAARRDLWKAEGQFAVLEEAQRRQLSAQEKSCWPHKDEIAGVQTLAGLHFGNKVTYQGAPERAGTAGG